jgi:hypothetical protein
LEHLTFCLLMSGAIPPLPQYAFMARCLVKAQGQLYLYLIQWVPEALSLGLTRLAHEADHSPTCSAEVKNAWSYTSLPQHASMAWCSAKKKAQGQLYPYLSGSCWKSEASSPHPFSKRWGVRKLFSSVF